jgi:hypothetical protein
VLGVRRHTWPVAVVAAALAMFAVVMTGARPSYHASRRQPPHEQLPYSAVRYSAQDSKRAFARTGIRLVPKSSASRVTTLGTSGDLLEVDAFGEPARVERFGTPDYITDSAGNYVHIPRKCTSGLPTAERWRGNIRVVISCTKAGSSAGAWLSRVDHALAHL